MTRWMVGLLAAALLYTIWVLAPRWLEEGRPAPAPRPALTPEEAEAASGVLRIVQFYAYPGVIEEGERASLCYGVSGAVSVELEPRVEALRPSRNRCLAIAPDDDTRYTLRAKAENGRTVSESFVLRVVPDESIRPKIVYFVEQRRQKARDVLGAGTREERAVHTLCFLARNVKEVRVDPPAVPPTSAVQGCFYVAPPQETTYTLTVTGPKGRKVERQVRVGGAP